MANLKKVLAGSLSLCLAASMFTACGNTDSSSTSDKNGGSTSVPDFLLQLYRLC